MSYIVSITAHRNLTPESVSRVHAAMKSLVSLPHVDAIYFGGARGGDTEALRGALHHRGTSVRPRLVVVVPNLLTNQPYETRAISEQADEVIELKNEITKENGYSAYAVRDQYLVDSANSLVAFFSGDYKTGTGKTIRMAEKKGIRVTLIGVTLS